MSNAISAQGTKLYRQPAAGGGFTLVAEVRDMTPPPITRNAIEITNQNELDNAYIVGIRRSGELSCTIGWVPTDTTHDETTGLLSSINAGDLDVWKVEFPDATYMLFSGYLTNFAIAAPVDDGLTADVSIRPTGPIVWNG